MEKIIEGHTGSVPKTDHHDTATGAFSWSDVLSDGQSTRIWNSRLSWKIVLAVFLTIMAVQAFMLALTLRNYQNEQLAELRANALSVIAPMLAEKVPNALVSPLDEGQQKKILSMTEIRGLSIYSTDFNLLSLGGEPVVLSVMSENDVDRTYLSQNKMNYETVFRPKDLGGRPYYIVCRMDATKTMDRVAEYVRHNILIMVMMSAFVTTILMIALGKLLLEPIMFLRDNLSAAISNPETPHILKSPYDVQDDIGRAIQSAQELIRQNAKNLRQVKATAQSQIHKLAYYDPLTNLPNRTFFIQKLSDYVRQANSEQTDDPESMVRLGVVAIDLDHFKDVNDSMGHNVGDAILGAVGRRLKTALPESAVVARTGEDEFAVMFPLTSDVITGKDVGEKIRNIISHEPFRVFNESFQVRASIGVSTFPDDALDPTQVLKNADIALNRAKEDGRDCIREYLEDFDKAVQARFQMLRDLRNALEGNQLSLHFQPQLDLKTGTIIGAEALLRWFKPDHSKEGGKNISPAEFIPIAEQSGLIVPIGEWVMEKACEEAKRWHDAGHPIRIAVNVSGEQFQQSDLVAHTRSVIEKTGIAPHLLELEVTESAFMEDIQQTIKTLKELHALGVELAIDDFGTGYSSLSYLRQFPIDRLKIDQSFIRNALNNADDAAIAKTIIALGRSLNLKIIAEGVESADHEQFLVSEGCDEVQGYRYSRPVPSDKFVEFINRYTGDLSFFG